MTTPPAEPRGQAASLPPPGWLPDPGNTNPGNTNPGNTGPGNTGPGNTGPGNTGPGNTNPSATNPHNARLERYWNGWNWTDLTRERVTTAEYAPGQTQPETTGRRPPLVRPWIVALALAAVLAVGAAAYTGFLPSWVPASQASKEIPAGAVVGYPVFGSDGTVTYLARGMVAQQESIDVTWLVLTGRDVVAEVDDAMAEAQAQNPYLFVSGWRVRIERARAQVFPDYIYPADEAERRRVATASAVAAILAVPSVAASADASQKVGALHDAVLRASSYDQAASAAIVAGGRPETSANVAQSQEAYGALVAGAAVCNGYAQAFQLLAAASGITSVVVTGEANGGVTTGDHAWNRVLIDGRWLVVDTTWDDVFDTVPRRDYLLMNPSDPRMATRAADSYWVVDANTWMYQ